MQLVKKLPEKRIIGSAIALIATFSAVFSGDFTISGFYIFFAFPIIIAAFRFTSKIHTVATELLSALAMAILFTTIMLANSADLSSYYTTLAFACIFVFSIRVIEALLERPEIAHFCALLLFAMLPFAIIALIQGDVRSSVVFGPNVYYRVIAYIYVSFLLSSLITGASQRYRFFFLSLAVIILLSTGSRGAVLVIIFLIILYLKATLEFSLNVALKVFFGVFLLVGGLLYNLEYFQERFWRLAYYDLANTSLQARLAFLFDVKQYLESLNFKDFMFGDGESQRVFWYYPHNIFLEAFVYHGVAVFAIFVAFGVFLVYALLQPLDGQNRNANLILLFSPIYLGSLVSGSFFEAYSVAAVSIFVLTRILYRKSCRDGFGKKN